MKTYSNKSNAKRAGVKAIAKETGLSEAEVKANVEKYFTIEGDKENGFRPHYITERDGLRVGHQHTSGIVDSAQESKAELCFVNETVYGVTPTEPGKGLKIEKDRPEQNGIIRPSVGGKCRAIWDQCDIIYKTGALPKPKQIKAWAEENGLNPNNALIEMYQWRKFNGIVGRQ